MRILIDTNVAISGTFWPGKSKVLLNAVRQGDVTYITSETLLGELREVLTDQGKSFRLSAEEATQVIGAMRALATLISPTSHVSICRDEDDNRVLECAQDGRADYIVTGDKDLLVLGVFAGIKIVNVSDFLQLHL